MPQVSASNQFEVNCSCGRQLAVSAGQAGTQITCDCGATVEVPTIRELRGRMLAANPAGHKSISKADPRATQENYGRAALCIVGIVMLLGGLAVFGSLYLFQAKIHQDVDPRFYKWIETETNNVAIIPPDRLWDEWQVAREAGLGEHRALVVFINQERARGVMYGAYTGLAASGLGLVMVLIAALMPRRK